MMVLGIGKLEWGVRDTAARYCRCQSVIRGNDVLLQARLSLSPVSLSSSPLSYSTSEHAPAFTPLYSNMSDMKATVAKSRDGFHVEGYEKIEYDFVFIDNVFDPSRSDLADCYKPWKRCLAVMDANIFDVYGEDMQRYFDHHDIQLDVHKTMIGEKAKSIDTYLSIVDSMTKFGIYRKVCGLLETE